jgi:putative acyl-CoA dehydrogenase
MRQALSHAIHHARNRRAFQRALVDQPLMTAVLADLALEAEAAALLAFRLAQSFDAAARDPAERELQRALTPVAKYWLCKRMSTVATEAMECLGGNGFVEEHVLARLYREAPLNGIWEGSANVICLDALRAFSKTPAALEALRSEVKAASDPRLDARFERAVKSLAGADAEAQARATLEALALCVQGSLMKRWSDASAAEAFCASRLGDGARAFGGLELGAAALAALVARARLG